MRVRFFGTPWPSPERRASICGDDQFKVPTPVGEKCIECTELIKEGDRGIITACSMRIWGHFMMDLPLVEQDFLDDPDVERIGKEQKFPVAAYHLFCWLQEVVGGVITEKVAQRMLLEEGDLQLEDEGLTRVLEDATPGEGWFE